MGKPRPDMERLRLAVKLAEKAGMKGEFVEFVVIVCEFSFRVRLPHPLYIRRALRFKLDQEGYSPYGPRNPIEEPIRTKNVPLVIDQYVDRQLQYLWNEEGSDQSRMVLRGRIETLVADLTKPFQPANFATLAPQRGGYPWLAPWVASAVIYERLRSRHPKKRDARAIDAGLELASALLGRTVDQAQFHRKRREIKNMRPDFHQWFEHRYQNFKKAWKLTIPELLDPASNKISAFLVIW
ncbi:MAG TPA: hypothetical protein VKB81_07315 [Nitrospira sp.]|nr:hypothetical protein [Nitrospira sp.]